jgi:hypothetical protein
VGFKVACGVMGLIVGVREGVSVGTPITAVELEI